MYITKISCVRKWKDLNAHKGKVHVIEYKDSSNGYLKGKNKKGSHSDNDGNNKKKKFQGACLNVTNLDTNPRLLCLEKINNFVIMISELNVIENDRACRLIWVPQNMYAMIILYSWSSH